MRLGSTCTQQLQRTAALHAQAERAHRARAHRQSSPRQRVRIALKDIESNLRSVATASGTVVLPLFQGFTVPQLPTFTTSLASTASHASDETAAVSTTGGWPSGKGHKRGGKGGGGGGGGGGGDTRLCLVMEIARTSMIHARAPHIRWPYAVCYAAHQLNLWPRVSWPEASPTSLWTGSLGVASEFRVWGCLALVRDTSADKLSAGALPCVFLGVASEGARAGGAGTGGARSGGAAVGGAGFGVTGAGGSGFGGAGTRGGSS
ncbi:unnamed protein product [Closterium sp. NIES-54]